MKKQTRKEQLLARATRMARSVGTTDSDKFSYALGVEDGYRAALKDARKAVAADIDLDATIASSDERSLFPSIKHFLRPIR
jgi:hypothetical protein